MSENSGLKDELQEKINSLKDELPQNIKDLKIFIDEERKKNNCYTGTGISHMFSEKKPCSKDIVNAKNILVEAKAALQSLEHIDGISHAIELTKIDHNNIIGELVSNCEKLNESIKNILDPQTVSGVNPAIGTPAHQREGGKRSRRYNKKSKKTMRRRHGRTYRKK